LPIIRNISLSPVTTQNSVDMDLNQELFILLDNGTFVSVDNSQHTIPQSNELDIYKYIKEVLGLISEDTNSSGTISFELEYRNYVAKNISIDEVSENGLEIKMPKFEGGLDEYFESSTEQIALYFESESSERVIINNYYSDNEFIYIKLDSSFVDLDDTETFSIYYVDTLSDTVNVTYSAQLLPRFTTVLEGKNYSPINLPKKDKSQKTKNIAELKEEFLTLTENEYLTNVESGFKTDYNFFENHVKFGSARAKTFNVSNKLNKIRDIGKSIGLYDWLNTNVAWSLVYDNWSKNFNNFYFGSSRNILLNNNELSNAIWVKSDTVSVEDDYEITPDPTILGSTVQFSGFSDEYISQTITSTPNSLHTVELWVKIVEGEIQPDDYISFDVEGFGDLDISASVSTSWKRFSYLTTTDATGTFDVHIRSKNSNVKIAIWNYNVYEGFGSTLNVRDKVNEQRFRTIAETVSSFTPYEKFIFKFYFLRLSEQNFKSFIENELEKAVQYDVENSNFLLYHVPEKLIENDRNQFLTNFILIYGESFDQLWVDIKAINNITKYEYNMFDKVPKDSLGDLLKLYGLDTEINYYSEDVKNLFQGDQNLSVISEITSRRLLYTLPYLYKSKGTLQVIQEILNVFGIPRGIFDVIELGEKKVLNVVNKKNSEFQKYLVKSPDSNITVNINSTSITEGEVTYEFFINNFQNEQLLDLIRFTATSSIQLVGNVDNNKKAIRYTINGVEQFTTEFNIPSSNTYWTYIGVSITNGNCNVYVAQQEFNGLGIENIRTSTHPISGSIGSFSNVTILNSDFNVSISEFRIYGGALTTTDFKNHANAVRNVYTQQNEDLLCNINFVGNTLDTSGNNVVVAVTNEIENRYSFDEFFSFVDLRTINGFNMGTQTIFVDEQNPLEFLTTMDRINDSAIENINESMGIGVFLNPNEKVNSAILNKFGNSVDFVPNDVDDKQFVIPSAIINEISNLPEVLKSSYYWFNLMKFFNRKVFKLLSEFTRATSYIEVGVIIQNSILRIKKQLYLPSKIKLRVSLEDSLRITPKIKTDVTQPKAIIPSIIKRPLIKPSTYIRVHLLSPKKKDKSTYLSSIETKAHRTDLFQLLPILGYTKIGELGELTEINFEVGARVQVI
jgi:hypothetical protein